MSSERLREFGRYAGATQIGDERMAIRMEIGKAASRVLVAEKVGLLQPATIGIGQFLQPFLPSRLQVQPHHLGRLAVDGTRPLRNGE